MMAASPSAAGGFTASGLSVRKSEEIADLIDLFSKTQYRAKEVTPRVETIEKRCLELFGRDYKYSVIHNTNGEVCGHYPRQIVYLEYECTEVQRDRNGDSQLFDKVRGHDIKLLRYLSVRYICDLMVENKKVKFGLNVTSSEKVDKAQRYADFTLLSVPYPGCEFFKDYKDRDYTAEGLVFNWNQDYVDAPLTIPVCFTHNLNIDWTEYQSWDLVEQTQNYLKLLLHIINSDDESGLLVHCISGWDRTPLFVSLLRLSLWADGAVHASLEPAEILYLTIAYDWFLFGHMLPDRLSKGEEIFFFCFNFLKHIVSEKFSAIRKQRRKNSHFKDSDFTVEDLCQLKSRDRGSVTSLSSDFSLITEEAGAASSLTNDAVDLMPSRAPAAARWCPIPSERQARLEAVREVFLAAYSSTVGLKSSAPSPSGAISGLLEQFARGVGLRGTNTIV
ncbi:phosphatidylinositol-3,5-bisphosphate 3-phosphatase MTMR14 isoform X6 [Centroberyx affinis]|uniref:phosphatidylinositol-3,5-bisphosphate 3-phosphatase MTMR14 isoform X6 n=1 Tax=Centroberyx affinis TaxID=166261 RepID=UPI003A5C1483